MARGYSSVEKDLCAICPLLIFTEIGRCALRLLWGHLPRKCMSAMCMHTKTRHDTHETSIDHQKTIIKKCTDFTPSFRLWLRVERIRVSLSVGMYIFGKRRRFFTHAPIFHRVLSDVVVNRASRSCPNSPTSTTTRIRFPGLKPLRPNAVGVFALTSCKHGPVIEGGARAAWG